MCKTAEGERTDRAEDGAKRSSVFREPDGEAVSVQVVRFAVDLCVSFSSLYGMTSGSTGAQLQVESGNHVNVPKPFHALLASACVPESPRARPLSLERRQLPARPCELHASPATCDPP